MSRELRAVQVFRNKERQMPHVSFGPRVISTAPWDHQKGNKKGWGFPRDLHRPLVLFYEVFHSTFV